MINTPAVSGEPGQAPIYTKLGVDTRSGAVATAIERRIIRT